MTEFRFASVGGWVVSGMSGSHRYLDTLSSFHAMLSSFPTRAEVASVQFAMSPEGQVTVTVHLRPAEPAVLAAGLVDWERTLGRTETWAWRTLNGDEVHLAVFGYDDCDRTPIAVVSGPIPYDGWHVDYDLDLGLAEQIDTDVLYRWLGAEIARSWPFTSADPTTGVTT